MPEPVPKGIATFHWRGQLRYRCPLKWESGAECEYDSHSMQDLHSHMRTPHNYSGKVIKTAAPSSHPLEHPHETVPDDKDIRFREDDPVNE